MRPLKYILGKTFKNILRELKKKPLILIAYVFVILAFVLMAAASIFMPLLILSMISESVCRLNLEGHGQRVLLMKCIRPYEIN